MLNSPPHADAERKLLQSRTSLVNVFAHEFSSGIHPYDARTAVHHGFEVTRRNVAGTSIAQQVSEEMMSSGKEAVEADRAQALTIPVAAGAAVVIVILCSAVYSVLHYLF